MRRSRSVASRHGRMSRTGLSLIEVSISTLIVGLLLVAALKSSGQTLRSRAAASVPLRGEMLARELMTEILDGVYEDVTAPAFGPEAGEMTGNRSLFDDVDDWHGWSASPPCQKDGTEIIGFTEWQRDIAVQLVDITSPATVSATDQGIKRVTVTVRRNGIIVSQEVSLRSDKY